MKITRRSSFSTLVLMGIPIVCGLDRIQADTNPVLPAQPGQSIQSTVAANQPVESPDPVVMRAHLASQDSYWNNQKTPASYAALDDTITIDVKDIDEWFRRMKAEGKMRDQVTSDLVPFFNGIALSGVHPENPGSASDDAFYAPHKTLHLRFLLSRFPSQESHDAWARLLNQPVRNRRIRVSVGFENSEEMATWVDTLDTHGAFQFYLTVIPIWRSVFGGVIIGGALLLFIALASATDIVRDTTAPLRPDGLSPFSLGRVQMAFWFFLIITSFFLLWVVTNDTDTINTSALALMGISAGTALGGAFIDSGKTSFGDRDRNVAQLDPALKGKRQILDELRNRLAKEQANLSEIRTARAMGLAPDAPSALENDRKQIVSRANIAVLQRQLQFFSWSPWKVVLYDLLADENVVAFHRFQIFIWTIILGLIFVHKVYNELSMPEFSSTLLGLLGVSAGTYLGFKFPTQGPSE